jgi:hypothetical protein
LLKISKPKVFLHNKKKFKFKTFHTNETQNKKYMTIRVGSSAVFLVLDLECGVHRDRIWMQILYCTGVQNVLARLPRPSILIQSTPVSNHFGQAASDYPHSGNPWTSIFILYTPYVPVNKILSFIFNSPTPCILYIIFYPLYPL